MIKYLNTEVTFAEIPFEISLCINITGCPCHCPGCHSEFLWEDSGIELTSAELDNLASQTKGISCICFMGGDQDPSAINDLTKYMKESHPELKIAWYSGKQELAKEIQVQNFDYLKLGPYIEELGGLDKQTTNQKLYKIEHTSEKDFIVDITYKFWKNLKIES